jgi:putative tricarboxylic transport membrane protein
MISLWVQLLRVPYKLLYPLIILFCTIGAYSINFSIFDIFLAIFFGILGYILRKGNFELAPLVLAFILSRLMEQAFRQSLTMSDGSFWIFFSRPISAVAMVIALASIASAAIPGLRKSRGKMIQQIKDER